MQITSIVRKLIGGWGSGSHAADAAPAAAGGASKGRSGQRVDTATYTRLMSTLGQVHSAAPVSPSRPPLDINNQNFGCEIEVAAPKELDDLKTPPTAATVQHLMEKKYVFTIDGHIIKQDGDQVIEGGQVETNAQKILDIAKSDPGRIVATDPNTGEHHGFQDSTDPKMNTQFFYQYCKFKTFMEDKVRPAMDKIGWIAEDTVSCQAHAGVDEAVRYIEVKNQISTINKGGKEDIVKALQFLKEIGCSVHDACALQFHMDMRQLPPEEARRTLQNLVRFNLANENILYRVAQNGASYHRGVLNNFLFCQPLSSQPITPFLHAKSEPDLKKLWYQELFPGGEYKDDPKERPTGPYHHSRYYGLNCHSYWYRGSVEMRTPATTLDPDVASAHLDLALGIFAAAYNQDKYDWKGVHTLGFEAGKTDPKKFDVGGGQAVGINQMSEFLDQTVGDKPARAKLLDIFFKSGGTIDEKPKEDVAIKNAAAMMDGGYKFTVHVPDLQTQHPAADAVEAVDGVRSLHCELEVQAPGQTTGRVFKDAKELEGFLLAGAGVPAK